VELEDYELMREMRWSWEQLQATPLYVRRFCWDFTLARRNAEKAAAEREKGRSSGGAGT
jgi:hypothetical protein